MSFLLRIFTGFLLFTLLTAPLSARNYSDVSNNYKYSKAIENLTAKKTVKGYPDGLFRPDGNINRAEAVKVLINSNFAKTLIDTSIGWHKKANHSYVMFPDVSILEWYGKFVEVSYQNQVVQGYPDGLFRPGNNINFAEALKIILETYKVDMSRDKYRPNKLLYVKQGEWFEKYFTYAFTRNLINQDKFYHPGQLITRGEFVEIIYRLETMLKNKTDKFISYRETTSNEYRITIPRLNIVNINVSFANTADPIAALALLKDGMGHYLSPPDAEQKMVLFGHSSGYSWDKSIYKNLLREIDRVNLGDRIYINYKEKAYVFEVYRKDIIPESKDYTLIENASVNELIIYTCWPPDSIAKRYILYAKPV